MLQIPYFTTSGINVRYLKIIEPKVSQSFLRSFSSSSFAFLIMSYSCNTNLCLGSGISRNRGILLFVYRIRYNDDTWLSVSLPLSHTTNNPKSHSSVVCISFGCDISSSVCIDWRSEAGRCEMAVGYGICIDGPVHKGGGKERNMNVLIPCR